MPREREMPEPGEGDPLYDSNPREGTGSVVGDSVAEQIGTVVGDAAEQPNSRSVSLPEHQPPQNPQVIIDNAQLRNLLGVGAEVSDEELDQINQAQRSGLLRQITQGAQEQSRRGLFSRGELTEEDKERRWKQEGQIVLSSKAESGVPIDIVLDRDPGKLLGYMRRTLNDIEETLEPQGKQESRKDLQELFLAMPLLKTWEKPSWMGDDEYKKWKGVIHKAGDIMSHEFEFRLYLQQGWVKFANASSIDDVAAGASSLYMDQLNYLMIKSRANNLLVSAAFEWYDQHTEEFLQATPLQQDELRRRLRTELREGKIRRPKNKIKGDEPDDEAMDLEYNEADFISAQVLAERIYKMTARLAQKNFLVDKRHPYVRLYDDPKQLNPNYDNLEEDDEERKRIDVIINTDRRTIEEGNAVFAYQPASGGENPLNSYKGVTWLKTQYTHYKDSWGGFPVYDLLDQVDFNDSDFISLVPKQIYDYYQLRLYDAYRMVGDRPITQAYEDAQRDATKITDALFGVNRPSDYKYKGEPKYEKAMPLVTMALSKDELIDRAEGEDDPSLKQDYQNRLATLNSIFSDLENKYGTYPESVKPEIVKIWETGDLIDFNWLTTRPGRWSNVNLSLPQKVADSIQKPGSYLLAKSSKSLVEFAKQWDALKGGGKSRQVKIIEDYVMWRLNPPGGVGKFRPADADSYVDNLSIQLGIKAEDIYQIKKNIRDQEGIGFELKLLSNYLELDDMFNVFMYELITGIFKAGMSGK